MRLFRCPPFFDVLEKLFVQNLIYRLITFSLLYGKNGKVFYTYHGTGKKKKERK